jgi:hypothetical protein
MERWAASATCRIVANALAYERAVGEQGLFR